MGGHCSAEHYKKVYGPLSYRKYFSFTFVRNPFSRLVSAYTFLKQGGCNKANQRWARKHLKEYSSFHQFVMEWLSEENIWRYTHFKPQYHYVCGENLNIQVDYVGYFEKLTKDFGVIKSRLGLEEAQLPHRNSAGSRRPIESYYDSNTRKKVISIYKNDFEIFNFSTKV